MTPPVICSTVLNVDLAETDNTTMPMVMNSVRLTNMEIENDLKGLGPINSPETRAFGALSPEISGQEKELIELTNTPKKKKKKIPKPTINDAEEVLAAEDVEFNPSLLKKKKKKKSALNDSTHFDTQLAEAGIPEVSESTIVTSRPRPGEYKHLLSRFYNLLHTDHPELVDGYKATNRRIPALVIYKESKKTIFASFPKICEYLKRSDEHVAQYLFAELGTVGNFDGTRRLVIKGKFQQMQLETVIKRYMVEYVHCQTCKTLDTELKKGENRLVFLTCNKCESRRSVSAIKTGFVAHVGRRRNMKPSN